MSCERCTLYRKARTVERLYRETPDHLARIADLEAQVRTMKKTNAELQRQLARASAQGTCVHAVVREPEAAPSQGMSPTELRARSVVEDAGRTDVQFVDAQTAAETQYVERITLGDPDAVPRTPMAPTVPLPNFVDAALAHSVTSGVPDRIDPSDPLHPGDQLVAWFNLMNVCGSIDWKWLLHDPLGYHVGSYSGTIDGPASGCYGSYTSSYPLRIDGVTFWTAGEFSAELWLANQFSYRGTFTMRGPSPRAPFASNDVLSTPFETALHNLECVLRNDADPNGDPLLVKILSQPAHGLLTVNLDGTISYFPETNFVGLVTFDYVASDGTFDSLPATVTIYVGREMQSPG